MKHAYFGCKLLAVTVYIQAGSEFGGLSKKIGRIAVKFGAVNTFRQKRNL